MSVYLIRHGHTVANGEFYAGRADIPLNALGRAEARALVASLVNQPIDRIVSSPLRRAVETARPLADARALWVEIIPDLAELNFGDLQGQPKGALTIRKTHLTRRISGGESLRDLWLRLAPVAERLRADDSARRHTAVVAHFWSLRLLAGLLREMDLETAARARDARLRNAQVMRLDTAATASRPEPAQVNRS